MERFPVAGQSFDSMESMFSRCSAGSGPPVVVPPSAILPVASLPHNPGEQL